MNGFSAGIAAGVIANHLTTATAHIYNYLVADSIRDFHVRNAILTGSSEQKSLDKNISEAVTAGFSKAGALDTYSSLALNTILTSPTFISHIVDGLRVKKETPNLSTIISQIYIRMGGPASEALAFSSKFVVAIEETFSILSKRGLIDDEEHPLYFKEREDRFRRIEVALASLDLSSPDFSNDAVQSISRLSDTDTYIFRRIAENIEKAVNEVDVHGALGDIHRVALDDVFVDLTLSKYSTDRPVRVQISSGSHWQYYVSPEYPIEGWLGLATIAQRRVLLGNPGGGKSTHSKKICLEIARAASKGGAILPLFLQLRAYAAARSRTANLSILDYALSSVAEYVPDVRLPTLRTLLHYLLSVGRCSVVFDGLDEVLSAASRLEIAKLVNAFCDRYPLSSFLVTSRIVGYETAPLNGFEHFVVKSLDEKQMVKIFERVSSSVLKTPAAQIDRERTRFLADAKKKAEDLISNPLLLTLITIIHSRKKEIPDNRADLYATCATLLFERWDSFRDIHPDLPERYRLYALLMHLSSLLYEDPSYGGRINKSDLLKVSRNFFLPDYTDNAQGRAAEAASKLAAHLTGRAWILHEVGDQIFEFTHRTFLEFFYAQALDARFENSDDLLDHLASFLSDGQKTVPAHLTLQMRSRDKREVANKIARKLQDLIEKRRSQNITSFSADTLEYLTPTGDILRDLVRRIVASSISIPAEEPLLHVLRTENPLRQVVISAFVDEFSRFDSIKELSQFGATLDALGRFTLFSTRGLAESLGEPLKRLTDSFRDWQVKSPFVTRFIFDCTGDPDWDLVRKFGLRLWTNKLARRRSEGIFSDAFHMIRETALSLNGAEASDLSYFKLAKAVAPTCLDQIGSAKAYRPDSNLRGPGATQIPEQVDFASTELEKLEPLLFSSMLFVEVIELYTIHSAFKARVAREVIEYMASNSAYSRRELVARWLNSEVSLFENSVARRRNFRTETVAQLAS